MNLRLQIASPAQLGSVAADTLVLIVVGDAFGASLDRSLAKIISDAVRQGDFELKKGRTLYVHRPVGVKAARLLVSAAASAAPKDFKAAVGAALAQLKNLGAKHVAVAATVALTAEEAEGSIVAAHDASYVYRDTKRSASSPKAFEKLSLICGKGEANAVRQGLLRGQAVVHGMEFARNLANRPGNHCTPTFLAEQSRALAKRYGLRIEVLGREAVEKLGMGAFLAVAQGSAEPLKFIVARYDGAARTKAPVVLVGKGITFDSGGISIKPAAEMDEMKFDMCGAASVLGTLCAVAELKPKLNLVCVIPSCENMPGSRAIKPGDVVASLSGQTIEILNTDAEGRLILCDALTYVERFKPMLVVDVATLTGACVVALGHHHSGLFTSDNKLAAQMQAAAVSALDPCWRMPLDDEYDEGLKSNFADMANLGSRAGGAITAAMFLRRYTSKYRWAHLDIAGTAWRSGAAKGATGRPVPLLTHFVLAQALA